MAKPNGKLGTGKQGTALDAGRERGAKKGQKGKRGATKALKDDRLRRPHIRAVDLGFAEDHPDRGLAGNLFNVVVKLVDRLEGAPLSPAWSAKWVLSLLGEQRKARAGQDPVWAAIEARRNDGGAGKIFLSENLTIADWEEQRRIAIRLTPDPAWVPLARWLVDHPASTALHRARYYWQRLSRGWADFDLASLDKSLSSQLGAELVELSRRSHGWPAGEEFPTPQEWCAALRAAGASLKAYGDGSKEVDGLLDAWHELACDPKADPLAVKEAFDRHSQAELMVARDATEALQWVALHLEALWD